MYRNITMKYLYIINIGHLKKENDVKINSFFRSEDFWDGYPKENAFLLEILQNGKVYLTWMIKQRDTTKT
jgi:hypothetical protein